MHIELPGLAETLYNIIFNFFDKVIYIVQDNNLKVDIGKVMFNMLGFVNDPDLTEENKEIM